MIQMQEPETTFFLEAPAGLIYVKAHCENGKACSVEIQILPLFVDKLDVQLEVPGLETLTVDTAYGGDSFVLVDAKSIGFEIAPDEARELSETGSMITAAANEQIKFQHPIHHEWNKISFCQFTHAPLRFRMEFLAAVTQLPLIRENWTNHLAAQDVPREWRFFTPEEK